MSRACSARELLPSPLGPEAARVVLLGGGELGKEVALEAHRLGVEVVVVDRYWGSPASQVATRSYVVDMLDPRAVVAIVEKERPDAVIPEIEAVSTEALRELEERGFCVIPNARAVRVAMNRVELRRWAAEELGLPTTRYAFAESEEEAYEACERVGYPCLLKPEMSSSGHGHVKVVEPSREAVAKAYRESISQARGRSRRVVAEEYVRLEAEFTVLAYRHWLDGRVETETMEPVEHWRYGSYHYVESWQPSARRRSLLRQAEAIAVKVAEALNGLGVFGVELLYTADGRLLFSEVAPRPHDTGLVTMASQDVSEFQAHIRAALGLPVPKPRVLTPAASVAVYTGLDGDWFPRLQGVARALSVPGVEARWFGKPTTYPGRRMAVVLAHGSSVEEAREKARRAAEALRVAPRR